LSRTSWSGYWRFYPIASRILHAYPTGWRKGEILTLEWRDIQGDVIHLSPEIAKNKDERVIITVGEIANIIARRQAERVDSCPYVFHRQGNRIKHYNRAWRTVQEKAGLPVKLGHDNWRARRRMWSISGTIRTSKPGKKILSYNELKNSLEAYRCWCAAWTSNPF
jgi:integrase